MHRKCAYHCRWIAILVRVVLKMLLWRAAAQVFLNQLEWELVRRPTFITCFETLTGEAGAELTFDICSHKPFPSQHTSHPILTMADDDRKRAAKLAALSPLPKDKISGGRGSVRKCQQKATYETAKPLEFAT